MYLPDYSYWRARPTTNDFSLDVISKHPDFDGRKLKKYCVDAIDTCGVVDSEPFEVHFHNRSFEDVQAKISLDGSDCLTGKLADLEVNHEMWLVRAGKTLHLKAWHETNAGGARFVFTHGDKSVSLHAHGDISHKGIIAAAVFTERDPKPRPVYATFNSTTRGMQTNSSNVRRRISSDALGGGQSLSFGDNVTKGCASAAAPKATNYSSDVSIEEIGESINKEAAVGAGEYTEQKTHTVKGLDNPILHSIVRMRYMWNDELVEKLKTVKHEDPHANGFPAAKIKTFADLSNVPRVESVASTTPVRVEPAAKGPYVSGGEHTFDRLI